MVKQEDKLLISTYRFVYWNIIMKIVFAKRPIAIHKLMSISDHNDLDGTVTKSDYQQHICQ